MKKRTKRLLSIILSAMMMFSITSETVAANDVITDVINEDNISETEIEDLSVLNEEEIADTREDAEGDINPEKSAEEVNPVRADVTESSETETISDNRIIPVYLKNGVKVEDIAVTGDSCSLNRVSEGSLYTEEPYNCKAGDYIIAYDDDSFSGNLHFKIKPDADRGVRVNKSLNYPDESNPTGEEYMPEPDEDGYYGYDVYISATETISVTIDQPAYKTVTFTAYHASVHDNAGEEFEENRTRVREGDRLGLYVYPDDEYMIESVTAGGREAVRDPDDESLFILPSIDEDTAVVIRGVPVDREIVFEVKQAGYVYEVDKNSEVRKSDEDENTYLVSYKADGIGFSVTPYAGELPAVYYVGHDSVVYKAEGTAEGDKYVYFIDWSSIPVGSNIIITREGETFEQEISVIYPVGGDADDAEYVESLILGTGDNTVNAVSENIISANIIYGNTVSGNCISKTYKVYFGSTIKLTGMMAEDYNVGFVCARRGTGKQVSAFTSRHSFTKSYPVLGNMRIEIYPVERLRLKIKKEGTSDYISEAKISGSNTIFELEEGSYIGELYLGKSKVPANEYLRNSKADSLSFSGDDALIRIDPYSRKFTIKCSVGGKYGYLSPVVIDGRERYFKYSYSVNVTPVAKLTGITVKPLGQSTADSYEMCTDQNLIFRLKADRQTRESGSNIRILNGGIASLSMLECKIEYQGSEYPLANGTETVIKDGTGDVVKALYSASYSKLTLTSDVNEGELKLNFYKRESGDNETLLKSVPVRIKKDEKIRNTGPEVKLVRTSDSSLYLEFSEIDIQKPYRGRTYYKVEVTPKPGSIPTNIIQGTKSFFIARDYPVLIEYPDDYTEKEQEKIDKQNEKIRKSFRQQAEISVINDPGVDGAEWAYDVKVSCVNTKPSAILDRVDPSADEKIHLSGKEVQLDAKTMKPVYATKITLSKKKTSLFSGEKDVCVAVVNFDKEATCTTVTAADITSCPDSQKLRIKYEPVRKELIVSAQKQVLPGKHTIEITPYGNGLHQDSVLCNVTVYKSIDSIKITTPATEFVRPVKGSLTIKTMVELNAQSGIKPKSNKLTYSITDFTDMQGEEVDKESLTYSLVSVRNGTVTVKAPTSKNKSSSEDNEEEVLNEFRFRIKVEAADFAGNDVYSESEIITIKSSAQELGTVMLLKYDDKAHVYKKVADNSSNKAVNVRTEEIQNALLAVSKDKTVKDEFYRYELSEFFINANNLSFTTSNKSVLPISYASGNVCVSAKKTADNLKLTVKTKDGGNKKAVLALNVVYDEPYSIGARIATVSENNYSFSGTSNTVIDVRLIKQDKEGDSWKDISSAVNVNVSLKGGKIISKDILTQTYKIIVLKDKATLTIKDKKKNRSREYTIENTAYGNYKDKTVNISAANTLLSGLDAEQKIELILTLKDYDCSGKYLYLAPNCEAAVKKSENYKRFTDALKFVGGDCIKAENGCYIKITGIDNKKAKAVISTVSGLPVSGYDMIALCGTYRDNVFTPDSMPVKVKIKSIKPKQIKGNFKMDSTYKISASSPTACELTGNGKLLRSVEYKEIFNANFKGRPNKFSEYFVFTPTDMTNPDSPVKAVLKLKDGLTHDQLDYIKSSDGGNDRNAYVSYTASYGDDGYGNPLTTVTKTVRIKVVFSN